MILSRQIYVFLIKIPIPDFLPYRPKKQRAAESEADYGGEYDGAENYDETDPEDDGPPWDEDGEE